ERDGRVLDVAAGRRQRDGGERRARRLQAGRRAETEGRGGQQGRPAGRVEVEREIEVDGGVGSHRCPVLDGVGGRQGDGGTTQRVQRDRVHDVREHRGREARRVAARGSEQRETGHGD